MVQRLAGRVGPVCCGGFHDECEADGFAVRDRRDCRRLERSAKRVRRRGYGFRRSRLQGQRDDGARPVAESRTDRLQRYGVVARRTRRRMGSLRQAVLRRTLRAGSAGRIQQFWNECERPRCVAARSDADGRRVAGYRRRHIAANRSLRACRFWRTFCHADGKRTQFRSRADRRQRGFGHRVRRRMALVRQHAKFVRRAPSRSL